MKRIPFGILRKLLLCLECLGLFLAASAHASPVLLTFEDLSTWTWPNPYNGLTWNNFLPQSIPILINEGCIASGYEAGLISGTNVVFNAWGDPASISRPGGFDFDSAYVTAALMDNLQFEVKGYLGGTLKYDNTYTMSATSPMFIQFNYLDVDTVDFITSGGTFHGYSGFGPGEQFAMDNLTVDLTPTPEPDIACLLALGAAALTGWAWCRRRRNFMAQRLSSKDWCDFNAGRQ